MNKRDYYAVLGLTRACTSQDIRQSFHRLALKWHPDKCLDKSEAQLKFNEIHEAYSVLSDSSKKKTYDDYGHQGLVNQDSFGCANPNRFFQKGFQGAEKSAFDVLGDILKEKEDGYFFQSYDDFGIPENFKSSIKSFIEDNIFQKEQDRSSSSFFDTYKPTFMNPSFFMESSTLFDTEIDTCTTSFFSFQSTDMGEKTYSRTSTTVEQNGKVATSSTETFQNGKDVIQKEETNEYDQKHCNNNVAYNQTHDSKDIPKAKRASYIIINQKTQDDPLLTYTKDAEFYAAFELNKEFVKEPEAKFNINASSKKISKDKDSLNIRLMKKKPSKKNRN